MSAATQIDIEHLARLSRLELSQVEKEKLKTQLERILEHFKQLEAVDVEGIEPSAHAHDVCNVWEEDEVLETFTPDQALANAPAQRLQQVAVAKVVDDA